LKFTQYLRSYFSVYSNSSIPTFSGSVMLLLHLFHSIDESHSGTCFAAFRKDGFACYPLLSVAFIFMMSLILFRLFGRRYPVLSGQMPSYHVVRRQSVLYSGHPGSVMRVATGRIGGDGNSCSRQSPESPIVNLSILTASSYKHCCWP
jgi:hypothetical protein